MDVEKQTECCRRLEDDVVVADPITARDFEYRALIGCPASANSVPCNLGHAPRSVFRTTCVILCLLTYGMHFLLIYFMCCAYFTTEIIQILSKYPSATKTCHILRRVNLLILASKSVMY